MGELPFGTLSLFILQGSTVEGNVQSHCFSTCAPSLSADIVDLC